MYSYIIHSFDVDDFTILYCKPTFLFYLNVCIYFNSHSHSQGPPSLAPDRFTRKSGTFPHLPCVSCWAWNCCYLPDTEHAAAPDPTPPGPHREHPINQPPLKQHLDDQETSAVRESTAVPPTLLRSCCSELCCHPRSTTVT